jgi:hypothetical protein
LKFKETDIAQECKTNPSVSTDKNSAFSLAKSIPELSNWIVANGGDVNHKRIEVISTTKGSGVFTKR